MHCDPVFFDRFLEILKGTLDLNCSRCASKNQFRPGPDLTEDRERTPSNQAFCQFFDMSESSLVDPVVIRIGT